MELVSKQTLLESDWNTCVQIWGKTTLMDRSFPEQVKINSWVGDSLGFTDSFERALLKKLLLNFYK